MFFSRQLLFFFALSFSISSLCMNPHSTEKGGREWVVVTLEPVGDVCVLVLHPLLLRIAEGLNDAI